MMVQNMIERERRDAGMVRLNLWIKKRHHEELKHLSDLDGRSVSDLVRQIVGSFLRDRGDVKETSR